MFAYCDIASIVACMSARKWISVRAVQPLNTELYELVPKPSDDTLVNDGNDIVVNLVQP